MKKTPQPPQKKKKPAKIVSMAANPKLKEFTTEEFLKRYLDGEFDEVPPTFFTQKEMFE